MASGNGIIVSGDPKGVFLEGYVNGTPKPGTCMQIKSATEPKGGRFTYEVFNADADGDQRAILVLLPDELQGKIATDAYVSGTRCFLYCPAAGEEINMLVAKAGTGTGDTLSIGDLLMVNDGDGILIDTTGTPESEPFLCLETISDLVAAGSLVHCMYTGH